MVGAVAGHNGQLRPSLPSSITKRIKVYNPKKKKKMKKTKVDERAEMLIRDTMFKIILEQGEEPDKIKYVLSLYDGIAKKMAISLGYAKTFMVDAMKVEDVEGALKFSLKRAKAELRHVQGQINDMDKLVEMMFTTAKERNIESRNNQAKQQKIAAIKKQRQQQEMGHDRDY